jgi:hypothetical protein
MRILGLALAEGPGAMLVPIATDLLTCIDFCEGTSFRLGWRSKFDQKCAQQLSK